MSQCTIAMSLEKTLKYGRGNDGEYAVTKKDYELLARVMAAHEPSEDAPERLFWATLVIDMAGALMDDNPNFKYSKWLPACTNVVVETILRK